MALSLGCADPIRASGSVRRAVPAWYIFLPIVSMPHAHLPTFLESPRWLIEKDNDELAFALLKKLHFTGDNTDFINKQFQEMRDQIRVEKEQTVRSYKGILMRPAWRRRVFLACGVWIGVSLTGITGFLKDLVAIFTVIFSNKGANNPEPSDKSSSSTLKQSDSSRGDLPESKKCRNEIKKFRSRCFSS